MFSPHNAHPSISKQRLRSQFGRRVFLDDAGLQIDERFAQWATVFVWFRQKVQLHAGRLGCDPRNQLAAALSVSFVRPLKKPPALQLCRMNTVAFDDTKSYDREYFERAPEADRLRRQFHEFRVSSETTASVDAARAVFSDAGAAPVFASRARLVIRERAAPARLPALAS